jgi:CelD/BcsL family acetyltransferase involved in cellulose biosynthesis
VRHVASLEGGVDGFLARRSRELRKSLRRARRVADASGLVFESVRARRADAAALYERIQAVEATSWKARDGVGVSSGPMRAFYGHMLPRLCANGQQRTIFARLGDRDIGYILGAVLDREYRGLQFSYNAEHAALSIGALLQLEQVKELCEEEVLRYDLGTEMDYKRRWAEGLMETEMLVVVR